MKFSFYDDLVCGPPKPEPLPDESSPPEAFDVDDYWRTQRDIAHFQQVQQLVEGLAYEAACKAERESVLYGVRVIHDERLHEQAEALLLKREERAAMIQAAHEMFQKSALDTLLSGANEKVPVLTYGTLGPEAQAAYPEAYEAYWLAKRSGCSEAEAVQQFYATAAAVQLRPPAAVDPYDTPRIDGTTRAEVISFNEMVEKYRSDLPSIEQPHEIQHACDNYLWRKSQRLDSVRSIYFDEVEE